MQKVLFDEVGHIYTEIATGEVIKSVTNILKDVGFGPQNGFKSEAMNKAADKGNRVHKMYNDIIVYGMVCTDPDLEKYVDAFNAFMAKTEAVPVNGEYQVFGTILSTKIAGTVDLKVKINGKTIIIDFKTTKKIEKYHAYQLALYSELDEEEIDNAYILQVMPNGSYVCMSAEDIAPGCFASAKKIVEAYENGEKFEDFQALSETDDIKEYCRIANEMETLKVQLDKYAKKIKGMVSAGTAKCSLLEVSYRKPAVKDTFDEDGLIAVIDDASVYTGAEVKELIELFHTLDVGTAGSYAIKVVKEKKEKSVK